MTRARRCFFLLMLFFTAMLFSAPAFASIMVIPQRVVFEDRARSSVLLLMNTDNKPRSYRLSWRILQADEMGGYHDQPLDPNDPRSVANMVVFSPRQMTIEPNGRQNVRLSLRKPADLPPGEYRAHLQFDALPDDEQPMSAEEKKAASPNIKVMIGISIPIIVRTGGSPGAITLDDIMLKTLEDQQPALGLSLKHPAGSNSAYGQVEILLQKSGKSEQIGVLNNVSLYSELEKRSLTIPLIQPLPPGSSIKLIYHGSGEYQGQTLAEKEVTVSR